jgi:hypothetical protein
MIPFLLASVGGYLIGNSMKESQTFAKGGKTGEIEYIVEYEVFVNDEYDSYTDRRRKTFKDLDQAINFAERVYSPVEYEITKDGEFVDSGYVNLKNKTLSKYADGGETEDDDMGVQFIDYKDKEIMFEPHFKKYYSNDVEFDSLEKVKKYIDSGSKSPSWERDAYRSEIMADGGMMADGGTIELYYVQDANGNVKNISKSYEDADRFWEKSLKFNGDIRVAIVPKEDWEKEKVSSSNIKRYAKGGAVKKDIDGYVVYFGVFRAGASLTPIIIGYYDNLTDAEKYVEERKAKKEKGLKIKELYKMPINSEVRMGRDNEDYKKVKNHIHSEEKVNEFFKGKDSFYKKNYSWVKPEGYVWDNWELKKA